MVFLICQKFNQSGAHAVLLSLSDLAKQAENENILLENLQKLIETTGETPIGLIESRTPYPRTVSASFVQKIAEMDGIYFFVETSGVGTALKAKFESLGDYKSCLRFY